MSEPVFDRQRQISLRDRVRPGGSGEGLVLARVARYHVHALAVRDRAAQGRSRRRCRVKTRHRRPRRKPRPRRKGRPHRRTCRCSIDSRRHQRAHRRAANRRRHAAQSAGRQEGELYYLWTPATAAVKALNSPAELKRFVMKEREAKTLLAGVDAYYVSARRRQSAAASGQGLESRARRGDQAGEHDAAADRYRVGADRSAPGMAADHARGVAAQSRLSSTTATITASTGTACGGSTSRSSGTRQRAPTSAASFRRW